MVAAGPIVFSLIVFIILTNVCLSYRLHISAAGDSSALFVQDAAGTTMKGNCVQICAPVYRLCQSDASDLADTFFCLLEELKCRDKFCGQK